MKPRIAVLGPKARNLTAWAGASPTSAGPGYVCQRFSPGLKGRNRIRASNVPPFQGGEICLGTITWGFTPGCHITGFQPSDLRPAILDKVFKGELL